MRICAVIASASRLAFGMQAPALGSARGLTELGHDVHTVTGRDAYSSEDAATWTGLKLTSFAQVGPRTLHLAPGLPRWLARQQRFDAMILHGVWVSMHATAFEYARAHDIPVLLATHGMLSRWALNRSKLKKRIARALYADRMLQGVSCFWASSSGEAADVQAHSSDVPVAVIPHGVSTSNPHGALAGRAPELVFLGRLHPVKGIDLLVDAWNQVRSDGHGWRLKIAGPDELGLRRKLERRAAGDDIEFIGPVFGDAKRELLAAAGAVILPSLSEGLPVTVLEAWAEGAPVVMTRECNLHVGFEAKAALPIEASIPGIVSGLRQLFSTTEEERVAMGGRGRALVQKEYSWTSSAQHLDRLLRWMRGEGARPSCVRVGNGAHV